VRACSVSPCSFSRFGSCRPTCHCSAGSSKHVVHRGIPAGDTCSTCHKAIYDQWKASPHGANGVECTVCHGETTSRTSRHAGVKHMRHLSHRSGAQLKSDPFMKGKTCVSCHQAHTFVEHKKAARQASDNNFQAWHSRTAGRCIRTHRPWKRVIACQGNVGPVVGHRASGFVLVGNRKQSEPTTLSESPQLLPANDIYLSCERRMIKCSDAIKPIRATCVVIPVLIYPDPARRPIGCQRLLASPSVSASPITASR